MALGRKATVAVKNVSPFTRRDKMQLKVSEALNRSNTTEEDFFLRAYVYIYGCTADLTNDIVQWKMHNVVPYYLNLYCNHILESP